MHPLNPCPLVCLIFVHPSGLGSGSSSSVLPWRTEALLCGLAMLLHCHTISHNLLKFFVSLCNPLLKDSIHTRMMTLNSHLNHWHLVLHIQCKHSKYLTGEWIRHVFTEPVKVELGVKADAIGVTISSSHRRSLKVSKFQGIPVINSVKNPCYWSAWLNGTVILLSAQSQTQAKDLAYLLKGKWSLTRFHTSEESGNLGVE